MRIFFSLLTVITALHCSSRLTPASADANVPGSVTLLNASYHSNVPGYPGSRSSDYYFTVVINTGNRLHFDSAWIDGEAYPVFLSKQSSTITNQPVTLAKGDTVVVRVSFLQKTTAPGKVKAPVPYQGKALLRYHENAESKFLNVKEILTITGPNRQ